MPGRGGREGTESEDLPFSLALQEDVQSTWSLDVEANF